MKKGAIKNVERWQSLFYLLSYVDQYDEMGGILNCTGAHNILIPRFAADCDNYCAPVV